MTMFHHSAFASSNIMLIASSRWPSAIQDALKAIQVASKVMFLLYCIGISCVGLALVGSLIGLFATGRLFTAVNFMTSIVSYYKSHMQRVC